MKRLSLFSFLFGSLFCVAEAQTVSVEDALLKASQLRQSSRHYSQGIDVSKAPQLVYTKTEKGSTLFYVFNYPSGGFAIIGGDEQARELLGYSEQGAFDIDKIPDGLKEMLNAYSYQIINAIENPMEEGATSVRRKEAAKSKEPIEELIKTKWDQGEPFNYTIPKLGASYPLFVTGCNATAAAQIMKYYEYPTKGTGYHSFTINYNTPSGTMPLTFTADYTNTTLDWANMLDDYSGSYTSKQRDAVATLMYRVGVGMDMKYGPSSSGGSTSGTDMPGHCLTTYFKYSKSAKMEPRAYYTDEAWENLIYNELAAGHPILYRGKSGESGHAFVCHGYNAVKGGFAFNWGWGGYCDGYFPLTGTGALKPSGNGTGGAGEGAAYVDGQSAYIGLVPDAAGTNPSIPQIALLYEIPFSDGTYQKTINRTTSATIALKNTGFKNVGYEESAVSYALMFEDVNTGKQYFTTLLGNFTAGAGGAHGSAVVALKFGNGALPAYNGTYKISVVVRPKTSSSDSDWQRAYYPPSYKMPQVTVTGGSSAPLANVNFGISSDVVEVGRTVEVTADATYTGTRTYKSSNTNVATVDANGVIKGISQGVATITVTGAKTAYFNATTKTLSINVRNTTPRSTDFAISGDQVTIGNTLTITHTTNYDGKISYTSSDATIASVSNTGVVTGKKAGWATIYAKATKTNLYYGTTQIFRVYVASTSLPSGFIMTRMPYVGVNNVVAPSNAKLYMPVMNNSSSALTSPYVYYKVTRNSGSFSAGVGYASMPAKYAGTLEVDLKDKMTSTYFTNGKQYTITFYKDSSLSTPMNYPSITFTYYTSLDKDVNGDGKVNLEDLDAIKQSLLGNWAPSQCVKDLNGDGKLSIKDIVDFLK